MDAPLDRHLPTNIAEAEDSPPEDLARLPALASRVPASAAGQRRTTADGRGGCEACCG